MTKTITFDEMFVGVGYYLRTVGLSDIHLRKSTRSKLFNICQKVIYLVGATQEPLLMIGELLTILHVISGGKMTTENFLTIAEVTPCFILCLFAMAKSLRLIVKRQQIVKIFEDFKEIWPKAEDMNDETREIIEGSMIATNKLCAVYSFITFFLSMVYNLFPIFIMTYNKIIHGDTDYLLPYLVWYPYDNSKHFLVWMSSFVSQFYAGIFTVGTVISADCYFALMATHISMQLQLLCRDIRQIPSYDVTYGRSVTHKLNDAVKMHNKLIRLCKVVEEIFSPVILINLLGSSLLICILLFSITIAPVHLMVKYLMFIASAMTQIFMLSLYGNAIVEQSLKVSYAAYSSAWVDLNGADAVRFKRAIILIGMRSNRNLKISALGFTKISMKTFASILKAASSYFTLLRAVYQKKSG